MPKKSKKEKSSGQDEVSTRPAQLTFADLLQAKIDEAAKKSASTTSVASSNVWNNDRIEPVPQNTTNEVEVSCDYNSSTPVHQELPPSASEISSVYQVSQQVATVKITESQSSKQPSEQHSFIEAAPPEAPKFFIRRTKKGGVPVKVESRASGKKVTLIENVEGDAKKLLQELKNKFGTGGLLKEGVIELQGDCLVKVTKYLNLNKQLLKPYGTKT